MKLKGLIAAIGLSAVLAFAVACTGNGEAAETPVANEEAQNGEVTTDELTSIATSEIIVDGEVVEGVPEAAVAVSQVSSGGTTSVEALPAPAVTSGVAPSVVYTGEQSFSGFPLLQVNSGQSGIWVTGESVVSVEPDISFVNIGVETSAETVAEARGDAAEAMEAIIAAVTARGLEDRDIQTTSFNIWTQYDWIEVTENNRRTNKQILIGYRVSNTAVIKVRELDVVGEIIDDVATAGGDATRINGISFSIEDSKPFMTGLREAAVEDALAKAQHFADLTGVNVGQLVYIAQVGGGAPRAIPQVGFAEAAMAFDAVSTPISSGETQLRMSVQAVFAIE